MREPHVMSKVATPSLKDVAVGQRRQEVGGNTEKYAGWSGLR